MLKHEVNIYLMVKF